MKVLVNGQLHDSAEEGILVVFDDNEQEMFGPYGMKRFVSAPADSTVEERQALIDVDLNNPIFDVVSKFNKEVYVVLGKEQPEIVDFTFYLSRADVEKRVEELNSLAGGNKFWYLTLYSHLKNSEMLGKNGEI